METTNVKEALQDLIIRLQDAEKGYLEISKAVANPTLKTWLVSYASERHEMHGKLEELIAARGGEAEVKTSFLGDLHRMFIDVKINNTSMDNEFDAVVAEIERGSSVLLADYDKVLENLRMLPTLHGTVQSHRVRIANEVKNLAALKAEIESVEA